jgi:hypothetical protein
LSLPLARRTIVSGDAHSIVRMAVLGGYGGDCRTAIGTLETATGPAAELHAHAVTTTLRTPLRQVN